MGYSSAEVVAISGLTYRRLGRWADMGVLVPSIRNDGRGRGRGRRYSEADLQAACVLAQAARAWPDVSLPVSVAQAIVQAAHAASGPVLRVPLADGLELVLDLAQEPAA